MKRNDVYVFIYYHLKCRKNSSNIFRLHSYGGNIWKPLLWNVLNMSYEATLTPELYFSLILKHEADS